MEHIKIGKRKSYRDGSVVKNTRCSVGGPGFVSQQLTTIWNSSSMDSNTVSGILTLSHFTHTTSGRGEQFNALHPITRLQDPQVHRIPKGRILLWHAHCWRTALEVLYCYNLPLIGT